MPIVLYLAYDGVDFLIVLNLTFTSKWQISIYYNEQTLWMKCNKLNKPIRLGIALSKPSRFCFVKRKERWGVGPSKGFSWSVVSRLGCCLASRSSPTAVVVVAAAALDIVVVVAVDVDVVGAAQEERKRKRDGHHNDCKINKVSWFRPLQIF